MLAYKKIIIIFISAVIFLIPVFAFGQQNQAGVENINVDLQVPLPFIGDGTGTVKNLSEYMVGVYRVIIALAAIFAVIMLIIAGYQFMFAAGGERQSGAKKRIFGAAIGLILALLSFVILQAISPKLVELKLPDIPKVEPFFAALGGRCTDLSVDFFNNPDLIYVEEPVGPASSFVVAPELAECGKDYTVFENDINTTPLAECGGSYCGIGSRDRCIRQSGGGDECSPIYLYGNIAWGVEAGDFTHILSNAYVDYIWVYSICNAPGHSGLNNYYYVATNRDYYEAPHYLISDDLDVSEKARGYGFQVGQNLGRCPQYRGGNPAHLVGYVLAVEVNDDSSWFPTDDDVFAVGKNGCAGGPTIRDANRNFVWGSINFNQVSDLENILFTEDDFRSGIKCDLSIKRSIFPAQSIF